MTDAARFWDGIAPKYAKSPIRDVPAYEYTLDRTRSYLKDTDRVLELGAGTGSTALLLANGVRHYVASDLSPKMTEIAREKAEQSGASNIDCIVAGIDDPRFADESYDAVLALNLLHLVEDVPGALEQIGKMLPSGGTFISKTVCMAEPGFPLGFAIMRAVLPILQWLGKAPYVARLSVADLDKMVTDTGFDIVEAGNYPAKPPSRYIVARKR